MIGHQTGGPLLVLELIAFRAPALIFGSVCEDVMPIIESPCTKICTLDPVSGLCLGCGRTLGEIEHWGNLSAAERTRLMMELPERLASLRGARAASPDAI